MRIGPVGYPHLAAVENVFIALFIRAQAHAHHVRPGARFGHGQRAGMFATDQSGQVFPFLPLIAVPPYLVDTQVGMGAVRQPYGRGSPADLFHGNHVLQVPHACAAVVFLNGNAQQSHVAAFTP